MDHRIRSRGRRSRAVRYGLLCDWYGEEAARTEIAAHTHPGEELSAVLDRVLNELEGDELSNYARLAANWRTYCGEALEKYLTLGGLRNGVLTLTVPHSGLLSMISPSVELIQARIAADFGPGFCREIRLTSGGRKRSAPR